jgi:hypothetical protein
MILPKNNQKSYGVLHTESYFSFIGFAKKVNSEEIQSIDIYLNDELIDTILADKKLQKIENIYDIEGFGFTYDLPEEYIGKKEFISFRNHETQIDLQNSPYPLIDENHPKFNEYRFLNSFVTIDTEKIKDIYCVNSIGFLAIEENLINNEFINFINILIIKFPKIKINAFYFTEEQKNKIISIFKSTIQSIMISNLLSLLEKTEIFIMNTRLNENYLKLYDFIIRNSDKILPINIIEANSTIQQFEQKLSFIHKTILINPVGFGFSKRSKASNTILYELLCEEFNYTKKLTQEDSIINFWTFQIKYIFENSFFKKFNINLLKQIRRKCY